MLSILILVLKVSLVWRHCSGQAYEDDPPPADIGMEEEITTETIDQIIAKTLGGMDVAANKMIGPGGMILAELDMLLTEEQFQHLYAIPELGDIEMMPYFDARKKRFARRRHKRKAVRQLDLKWHNREVPYRFAAGHFSPREKYFIKVSMREWEKYTCIMFREATSSDNNILIFQNGDGCNSQLGMVGGVQGLNLDINGCRHKGLYLHEIGHAIGLVHEHQLPNRDDFIEVMYGNVAPSMRIWFNKYNNREVNQYDVDYEYTSVMHYGITAFSVDGKQQTIKAKNTSLESTIGKVWKKELSFSDVKSVNRLYQCGAHCPASVRCKDGGYVDQNCKCMCPDGTKNCQIDQTNDGTPLVDDTCFNKYSSWKCYIWASQGECEKNPEYMRRECQKSCLMCGNDDSEKDANHVATWAWQWFGVFANLFPKKWSIGECIDLYSERKCQHWQENGDCITADTWMTKNCKKTCNKCNVTTFDDQCQDKYNTTKCENWARKGECIINKAWMVRNCRKSCLKCTDNEDDTEGRTDDTNRDRNTDRTNNRDDTDGDEPCIDRHRDKEQCQRWANRNECTNNPSWMTPNCRRSCNKCGRPPCKDEHNTTNCQRWAGKNECKVNKAWMIPNCRKSCQACIGGGWDDTDRGNEVVTESSTVMSSTIRTARTTTSGDNSRDRDNNNNDREDTEDDTHTRRENTEDDTNTDTGNGGNSDNTHTSNAECDIWARYGHCGVNPGWMLIKCAGSCRRVANGNDESDSDEDNIDIDPVTTTRQPRVCEDDNPHCASWVLDGLCGSNGEVLNLCRKSCNNCLQHCRDRHVLCNIWGRAGGCFRNPGYMLRFCQKTCDYC